MKKKVEVSSSHGKDCAVFCGALTLLALPFLGPAAILAGAAVCALGQVGAKQDEERDLALLDDDEVVNAALDDAIKRGKKMVVVESTHFSGNPASIPWCNPNTTKRTTITLDDSDMKPRFDEVGGYTDMFLSPVYCECGAQIFDKEKQCLYCRYGFNKK